MHAPELLSEQHIVRYFQCGEVVLDQWLQRTALKNQQNNASKTFVVCDENKQVMGFYCLSAGSVSHQFVAGALRRNMPDPIPVIILGRLAVDCSAQGKQLGVSMLKDAVLKSKTVANQIGVKALLVHALNQQAKQFYLKYGFSCSPIDEMVLMLKL